MNREKRRDTRYPQRGFTLPELLIAMAITGIVAGAMYSTYKSQQDSYMVQEQVAEIQQNLRAALYLMGRDIRMAGYDPTGNAKAGFVVDLPTPNDAQGAATDATNIAFTKDMGDPFNADPDKRDTPNEAIDNDDSEQSAYRLFTDPPNDVYELQRYIPGSGWTVTAEGVEVLDFVYLDGQNPPVTLPPPLNDTALRKIRSIQVTLVARAGHKDKAYKDNRSYKNLQGAELLAPQNDNYRRRILSTTIQCRNMGL